jgi:hypothetical protein
MLRAVSKKPVTNLPWQLTAAAVLALATLLTWKVLQKR